MWGSGDERAGYVSLPWAYPFVDRRVTRETTWEQRELTTWSEYIRLEWMRLVGVEGEEAVVTHRMAWSSETLRGGM